MDEVRDLEAAQSELQKRLVAEGEASESARIRAEVAGRGREFVDAQIDELKVAYNKSVDLNRQMEAELTTAKSAVNTHLTELASAREHNRQLEEQLAHMETSQSMAMEIECLRAQLSEMRRQLVKRDMDDESASISPKYALDREQNSRIVCTTAS